MKTKRVEKRTYVVDYEGRRDVVEAYDKMTAVLEVMKDWLDADEETEVSVWDRYKDEDIERYDVHKTDGTLHIFESIEM